MASDNRVTLERFVGAMIRGEWDAVGEVMADDAVVDWPQSGERMVGRQACLMVYRNYPGGPPRYELQRITGGPDVFTIEARGDYPTERVYMTSIVEFRDGKIVHQTEYWPDPFPPAAWRLQWVERM